MLFNPVNGSGSRESQFCALLMWWTAPAPGIDVP